jgi:hypothetical protein
VRVDFIDAEELEPAGAQVHRAFQNRARLAGMRRDDLPRARLARAMPIIAERTLGRSRGTLLIDAGTNSTLPASDASMRVVERLDGTTTLTRLGADRAALSLCRTLLELGALRFA